MGLTYRERRERRAARREEWADKRERKRDASLSQANRIADGIPPGQPILVGHHSERRHRRDLDRIDSGMRKGYEHDQMAKKHRAVASTIRDQLDRSVYDDDRDACERLRERIAEREAKRDRMKAVNRIAARVAREHGIWKRKGHWLHTLSEDESKTVAAIVAEVYKRAKATAAEKGDLMAALEHNGTIGYPSYALSNIGSNIRRDQQRLEKLEPVEAQRQRVAEVLAAERAKEAQLTG